MLASFNLNTMMSQANQIKEIPVDMLIPYHNHKFSLYTGERLQDMVASVKQNGILIPIIVQPINDGESYEILSGHNRVNAAKIAGMKNVPAVIKEGLSEDEAELYVVMTNTNQRGFNELKISEQAAVLSMRRSKLFSEEKRKAIAEELAVLEGKQKKKNKLEQTGEDYGLKKDTVARLLRVDMLIDGFKPWVDSKVLSVRAAVELSYIPTEGQEQLYTAIADKGEMGIKIDMKKAKTLRKAYTNSGIISDDELLDLLDGTPKEKTVKAPNLSQAEIYAVCDSGAMNSLIEGYCRKVFADLGLADKLNEYAFASLFEIKAEEILSKI